MKSPLRRRFAPACLLPLQRALSCPYQQTDAYKKLKWNTSKSAQVVEKLSHGGAELVPRQIHESNTQSTNFKSVFSLASRDRCSRTRRVASAPLPLQFSVTESVSSTASLSLSSLSPSLGVCVCLAQSLNPSQECD